MSTENSKESMARAEAQIRWQLCEGQWTAVIQAKMSGGRLISVTDGNPIELEDGTFVQLSIIGNRDKLLEKHPLVMEKSTIEFLPANTRIFCGATNSAVTDHADAFFLWEDKFSLVSPIDRNEPIKTLPRRLAEVLWLELILREPARLRIQGDREARLLDAQIFIPALEFTERSLNSAVARLIGDTQKKRKTNSANVFRTCVALIGDVPVPLDEHRTKVVAEYRKKRALDTSSNLFG